MLAETYRDAADIDIDIDIKSKYHSRYNFERLENEPENVSCRESGEESAKTTFIVSQARCTRAGQTFEMEG